MSVLIPASPYDHDFVEEQPLANAPLVRVLAQVRHPALLSLAGGAANETALRVAQALDDHYPIFEAGSETAIVVTPAGVKEHEDSSTAIWRLRNPKETWQVSFAKEFIAIETSSYEGRTQFCEQLNLVLSAYVKEVHPPSATRIGVRYTNRVTEQRNLERIRDLTRPELLGPVNTSLPAGSELSHYFSQAQFATVDGGSLLRWGLVPAGNTFDSTLAPASVRSWVLDIDAFHSSKVPFETGSVTELARSLATRAHTHFRWAVTEEFLAAYRGS